MACLHTNMSVHSSAWPTVYILTTVSLLLKTPSSSSLGGSPTSYRNHHTVYTCTITTTDFNYDPERLTVPMYNIHTCVYRCMFVNVSWIQHHVPLPLRTCAPLHWATSSMGGYRSSWCHSPHKPSYTSRTKLPQQGLQLSWTQEYEAPTNSQYIQVPPMCAHATCWSAICVHVHSVDEWMGTMFIYNNLIVSIFCI